MKPSACMAWPLVWLLLAGAAPAAADSADPLDRPRTLAAPSEGAVRERVLAWVASQRPTPLVRSLVEGLWAAPAAAPGDAFDPLERLVLTVQLVDGRAAALVEASHQTAPPFSIPLTVWLDTPTVDPWMRDQVRYYFGRWLARNALYDEALEQLAGLEPELIVDPSGLLFFQAVACHALLRKEPGLAAIDRLLNDVADAPRRYTAVADLMRRDLAALEAESLDHIARQMDDIRRRLDFGRAGRKVVRLEDDVVDALDKLIDELEKQQQQQQGGGGGGSSRPSSPLPDSRIAGGKGEGRTDRKPIGGTSGWGDLPPKQREEALQQVGKDFPAHYRDVIEAYFRNLAGGEAGPLPAPPPGPAPRD